MSLVSSFTDMVFSWFKGKEQVTNPTKRQRRAPVNVDFTESMPCNLELTKGLYHNSYPGLKLAGAMAYTPIATPILFMGVPVASVDDNDDIDKMLKSITKDKIQEFGEIHLQSHREGTIWIYPHYSIEENKVIWEFIQDEVVTDIIKDINTKKIIKIITDEDITITTDYNKTATVRRQRIFTKTKVETKWLSGSGTLPGNIKDRVQKNVSGVIPIYFSNNKDGDEIRGHSDYERILSDLKNYHDIDYRWSLFLAKFGVKMIIEPQNVKEWLNNNGYEGNPDNIDIARDDIFINIYDKERVSYVFPEGAFEAYAISLKKTFRKLVEGSGIAEILWGNKVSGNLGSYEDQMDMVIKLVNKKRTQKTKSYNLLFSITLKLEMMAKMQNVPDIEINIEWDYLDAISEETKSIIFKNFAEGIATLITAAGITKDQAFELWMKLYPGITGEKLEEYKKGIMEMAEHVQYTKAPLEIAADFRGDSRGIDDGNGNGNGELNNALKIIQEAIKNNKIRLK